MVVELDRLILSGNAAFGSVVAAALTAAWKVPGAGYLIPLIQGMVIEGQLRGDENKGSARGLHYLVSTGPREDSDQTDFRVDSIEVVFDATYANYLAFLDEILPIAPRFQQAGYINLRPSLGSSTLLSMHNEFGNNRAISIEIASLKNLPGNAAWMSYVHQAAVRYGGRPHWGQYNKLDTVDTAMLYAGSFNPWREALTSVSGTSKLFSNAFTHKRGLEPVSIIREVTAVRKGRKGPISRLCNDDAPWSPVSVRQAIREIRAGTAKYFARFEDDLVEIRVVDGRYLRTAADDTEQNNLDNLPRC
jgi:Protein of unknown function (DUF3892)